jgi:hypothetical protein
MMLFYLKQYSSFFLLFFSIYYPSHSQADIPKKADIAKIYNIEKAPSQKVDVRFFRKGECDKWCAINGEGEYLKAQDFLQTGDVSRADLALMFSANQYSEVLFWQQEGSRSKFDPKEGTCHFKVDIGGFLYAHPHQSINPGCKKIVSNNALVFPNGTALFIEANENETMVGALSNRPGGLIKVEHLVSHESVGIKPGEYAKALQNGKIVTGIFSLEDFYRKKTLGLGLGPDDKDENYVREQAPEVQVILNKLRAETLAAVDDQKKMIADGKLPDFTSPMDPKGGGTGTATVPASQQTGATAGINTNSGGTSTPATSTLITPSIYLNPNIKVFIPPPQQVIK